MMHATLLDDLVRARNWTLVSQFESLSDAERIERFREGFRAASTRANDEDSVLYLGWLMRAIAEADAAAHPLPDRKEDYKAYEEAEKEAKARVACAQANEAIALYDALPTSQKKHAAHIEWTHIDGHSKISGQQALQKTRKALILEIGKGWGGTRSHAFADDYFAKILDIQHQSDFYHRNEPVKEAVRETLGSHEFPFERLVHTLRVHPDCFCGEILARAWVKHLERAYHGRQSAAYLIAVVAEYREASTGAVEYVRLEADKLLMFDRLVRTLPGLPYGAVFEYEDTGTVTIRFDVKAEWRSDENAFHRQFEETRNKLKEGKGAWGRVPHIKVFVEGRFVEDYGERKIRTTRKEEI